MQPNEASGAKILIEFIALIFVVEEDKSLFEFNERFEMIQKGTSDIGSCTEWAVYYFCVYFRGQDWGEGDMPLIGWLP